MCSGRILCARDTLDALGTLWTCGTLWPGITLWTGVSSAGSKGERQADCQDGDNSHDGPREVRAFESNANTPPLLLVPQEEQGNPENRETGVSPCLSIRPVHGRPEIVAGHQGQHMPGVFWVLVCESPRKPFTRLFGGLRRNASFYLSPPLAMLGTNL